MDDQQTAPPGDKKAAVGAMFDDIASRYDFLNHFLSFGIDRIWRRKAVRIISRTHMHPDILDMATGTGDLAIAAMKLNPIHITGIDISEKMLAVGREKIIRFGLSEKIELLAGQSEKISFPDCSFDVAMSAFGVRNFADPKAGLTEMGRVLKNGGLIMVLEFSIPSAFPFRQLYKFYFLHILPFIGRIFSKNSVAYRYLPETVMKFPENEEFLELLKKAGFGNVNQKRLTGGVASIYTGIIYKTQ
ncbi:MAG: bifunctional demethylmenaquinone methyltransferase/2-methoxy-6-polyprenyl-1,4-benzoquinol methylase UbiE [Bacteroidales bacterium]